MASECQFSSMQHISTEWQNHLMPAMFKAVQILKGGYKAGMLSANIESAALAKELKCRVDEMIPNSGPSMVSK